MVSSRNVDLEAHANKAYKSVEILGEHRVSHNVCLTLGLDGHHCHP